LNQAKLEKALTDLKMPMLGDSSRTFNVVLTEPEINAIHAAYGFIQGAGKVPIAKRFWDHYGPTMEALSKRLQVYDDPEPDSTAPVCVYPVGLTTCGYTEAQHHRKDRSPMDHDFTTAPPKGDPD